MSEYDSVSLRKQFKELDVSPALDGYSGVEIVVDEDTTYFSGSVAGRVLTIENPWGTQEQADNILAAIQGFQYQPYTATGALLDPAAELGDGVNLNGLYSGLFKISRNFSRLMAADISAPADEEVDHEYPYETKENRKITRRFSAIESEFRIQSDEISAKVSETGGDNNSVSWSLTSEAWTVKANGQEVFRIDSSGATVTGVISATSGVIGNFNIGSNAIWNNIDNLENAGALSRGVYLGTDGIRVGANFKVDSGGNISAVNANLSGTLTVGGSTITAAQLRSGAYSAYTNGGTWSTGSGYGFNYNNATKQTGGSYPNYFRAGILSCNNLQASIMSLSGSVFSKRTATIAGTTIAYVGWG